MASTGDDTTPTVDTAVDTKINTADETSTSAAIDEATTTVTVTNDDEITTDSNTNITTTDETPATATTTDETPITATAIDETPITTTDIDETTTTAVTVADNDETTAAINTNTTTTDETPIETTAIDETTTVTAADNDETTAATNTNTTTTDELTVATAAATTTDDGSYKVYLPKDVVPTAETKITLANLVSVSPLILGTWAWGDKKQWGWNDEMDGKAKEAFDMSISKGINTFDTAEIYGNGESERCIARYKENQESGTAQDIVLATKFLPSPLKLSYPSSLINALRASLGRLKVSCVDLYQIHGHIHIRSIEVIANALAEAVKLGLTKTVGVSNYSTQETIKMYDCLQKHGIQLASNQVEFSLLRRTPETSGLIAECHKRGIAILGYSPLAMGRLTGKYSKANPPPSGRGFSNVNMAEVDPLIETMRGIGAKYNVSVSSVALNYVICKGVIPLGGARDGKQAEQNAGALGWRLTDEEITQLESHPITPNLSLFNRFWQHG